MDTLGISIQSFRPHKITFANKEHSNFIAMNLIPIALRILQTSRM